MSDPNPTNLNPDPNPADEAIDAALDTATGRPRASSEVPLKRQWDADLDAELEAAMAGFDPKSFDVATPRTRAADRAHVPKPNRGREAIPGPQPGKVIAVRAKSVFVDLGAKSEGVVPVEQFQGHPPNPGDLIEVVVDRFDADEGLLILSLKGAAVEANWENVHRGMIVEARVLKTNKGGLEVDVDGIRGFMPIGQIDINRVEDASAYVNQRLRAIVTEANSRERNLVVSRRELLERERAERREATWAALQEGQVRQGVVRSIKDFGAFVDLGGVDGLLHVAEMSWSRLANPAELLKVGQEVQVKVLKIDRQTSRVSLGLKQLTPSPWDRVEATYARGMTVRGKVTRVLEFGAFVELEPGIEGLIHISELAPNRVRRVADLVKPGQEVEVRILKIEPEAKRIALSLRPAPNAPAGPEPEEDEDQTPPPPKPPRTIPLKGGLGDRDPIT
ncbi:MAG TPA: S1 RNA-binding domain-containing protein [Isosphaeraceae bacterium]|nr:S1 RNA-binding domain-containing protein [Isosphaeraceae bacterium]